MNTEEKLVKMKKEIDEAKTKKSEHEGSLKQLLIQLKKNFDCPTIEDAKKLLKRLDAKYKKYSEELEEGMTKLEEEYEL